MRKGLFFLTAIFIFSSGRTIDPTAERKFDSDSKGQCINICKEADMAPQSLVVLGGISDCVVSEIPRQNNFFVIPAEISSRHETRKVTWSLFLDEITFAG